MQSQQIRYCYNIGAVTANSNYGGIAGRLSSEIIVENATTLYLNTLTGVNAYGTAKSDEELKNSTSVLNASQLEPSWINDGNMINGGYPILSWQAGLTSILEPSIGTLPNAYFNASKNTIIIEGANKSDVCIFNMQGMICIHEKVIGDNFEMAAGQLNTGCYIIVLNNGHKIENIKIIK